MNIINAYEGKSYGYNIYISNELDDFDEPIRSLVKNHSSIIVFIDSYIVETIEAKHIVNKFKSFSKINSTIFFKKLIKSGKHCKNFKTIEKLIDWLIEKKIQRDSLFVAIGGGVTGDLIGFISTIYYRGVSLCHIPSNLIAMTDSSIGGKTAVNTKMHVNSCGTYKHPNVTLVNTRFLSTLPERDFKAGFAEVLKIALLKEGCLNTLLSNINENESSFTFNNEDLIKEAIKYKLYFTSGDIEEKSKRLLLNIGHTFAHAIESVQNLNTEEYFRHGEAVSLGLIASAIVSDILFGSNLEFKITKILKSFKLPTRINKSFYQKTNYTSKKLLLNALVEIAFSDKKGIKGDLRLILLKDIYKPEIYTTNDKNLVRKGFAGILDPI